MLKETFGHYKKKLKFLFYEICIRIQYKIKTIKNKTTKRFFKLFIKADVTTLNDICRECLLKEYTNKCRYFLLIFNDNFEISFKEMISGY